MDFYSRKPGERITIRPGIEVIVLGIDEGQASLAVHQKFGHVALDSSNKPSYQELEVELAEARKRISNYEALLETYVQEAWEVTTKEELEQHLQQKSSVASLIDELKSSAA